MNVLVDTSVWSLALRRNSPNEAIAIINLLRDLIADGKVVLLGAIRQNNSKFKIINSKLQHICAHISP